MAYLFVHFIKLELEFKRFYTHLKGSAVLIELSFQKCWFHIVVFCLNGWFWREKQKYNQYIVYMRSMFFYFTRAFPTRMRSSAMSKLHRGYRRVYKTHINWNVKFFFLNRAIIKCTECDKETSRNEVSILLLRYFWMIFLYSRSHLIEVLEMTWNR